jgi:hypothetical protein
MVFFGALSSRSGADSGASEKADSQADSDARNGSFLPAVATENGGPQRTWQSVFQR